MPKVFRSALMYRFDFEGPIRFAKVVERASCKFKGFGPHDTVGPVPKFPKKTRYIAVPF